MSLDRTALTYSTKTVEQLDLGVYVQKAKYKSICNQQEGG